MPCAAQCTGAAGDRFCLQCCPLSRGLRRQHHAQYPPLQAPAVSVITPVCNTAPFLRRMLQSVLNQTLENIEHILIDDGSTDGSAQILDEYAREHPARRITVIHQPNSGVPAYNPGLERACGEYVAFLDSDDYYADNFLELLYNKAVAEKADICKGEMVMLLGECHHLISSTNNIIRALQSRLGFTFFWQTAIYRTQMLRKHHIRFDTRAGVSQDALFQHMSLLDCVRLRLADEPRYYFRNHSNSTTHQQLSQRRFDEAIYAYSLISDSLNRYQTRFEPQGIGYALCRYIQSLLTHLAPLALELSDAQRCWNVALEFIRHCPPQSAPYLWHYLR